MYKYALAGFLFLISGCTYHTVDKSLNIDNDGGYEIFFANNSYDLDESSKTTLRAVSHVIAKNSPKKIIIKGNADRSGSLQHNKGLSMKRAEAVAKFLEDRGVNKKLMDIRAYGASAAWTEKAEDEKDRKYRSVKVMLLKTNTIEYR